jgi:hypothetical protein
LLAEFTYTDEEIDNIKKTASAEGKYEFKKETRWLDSSGDVISVIERTIYVATKEFYRKRLEEKKKTS